MRERFSNINKKHQFIFVHIPKTGGQSLSSMLELDGEVRHFTEQYIRENSEFDLKNYFSFAFVRNPWSRFLSLYFYLFGKDEDRYEDVSFKTFVNLFYSGHIIKNHRVWEKHYSSQLDYIDKSCIGYVGRFETMQSDFDVICEKIGFNKKKLPHKNKTKHSHYTEYYDKETEKLIAEKYADDIEYFGYSFGQ